MRCLLLIAMFLAAWPAAAAAQTTTIPYNLLRGLAGYCTPAVGGASVLAVVNTGTSSAPAYSLRCLDLGGGFAISPTSLTVNATVSLLAPYTCVVGSSTACATPSQTFAVPQPPNFSRAGAAPGTSYQVALNGSIMLAPGDFTAVAATSTAPAAVTFGAAHAIAAGDVVQIW